MSWVRWSTAVEKGVTSDLYIYDSVGDYIQVYVAGRKRVSLLPVGDIPDEPTWPKESTPEAIQQWHDLREINDAWWDEENIGKNWHWVDLNPEYEGKSYQFTDIDELIVLLKELKSAGINFPEYVFEQADEARTEY